jgi:hypothetical protein
MYLDDLLFVDEEVAELYLQQNARLFNYVANHFARKLFSEK